MGRRFDGVCKVERGGKLRLVIDFRYCDKDGRQQRYRRDASVQLMAAARAEYDRLKTQAVTTGSLATRPAAPTFRDFVEKKFVPLYMPAHCRPSTRERYNALFKQGLLDFFGAKRMDAPWSAELRGYEAILAARKVQSRPHLSLLRTVMRAAFEFGEIERLPELPPLPKKPSKLPDAPGADEIEKLVDASSGWLRTAIMLSAYAGLRQGEVRALEVQDVDLENDRILIRHALSADDVMSPKSGHERVVPLLPELRAVLVEAVRLKTPRARVVTLKNGSTPNRQGVLASFKRLEANVGIRSWSFHAVRHAFGSILVRRGASIEAVRVLMGHSKLEITQRYIHATAADLEDAISMLRVTSGKRRRTLSRNS